MKMPPAAGGDHPPRTPCKGKIVYQVRLLCGRSPYCRGPFRDGSGKGVTPFPAAGGIPLPSPLDIRRFGEADAFFVFALFAGVEG